MNIKLGENIIKVKIIHKKNKNIYFRFDEELNLVVTCPKYTLDSEVIALINKNEESILKLYDRAAEKSQFDAEFYLLGKKYNISYTPDSDDLNINEDTIFVKNEEELAEFVKEKMDMVFKDEIDICKRCFIDLPDFTLKVRKMKTRWGVCDTKKKIITLNSELIKRRVELIDYVIIHEMAHFYQGNHSAKFWAIVESACPNYKERRKELKK